MRDAWPWRPKNRHEWRQTWALAKAEKGTFLLLLGALALILFTA